MDIGLTAKVGDEKRYVIINNWYVVAVRTVKDPDQSSKLAM